MAPILRAEKICSGYRKLQVLFEVSAEFPEKEITVIVGPNGSGKSTFLKTVFGLTNVYSGRILFNGYDITRRAPHEVSRMGIAYLPQLDNVFSELTVRENLMMAGYTLRDEREAKERVSEITEMFPILREYWGRKAGTLSGGEKQMLAMGMALMRRPQLMLFDEPTGNLAPKVAIEVLETIKKVREEYGVTVLLAEQNAKRALEYGDGALLLVSGQVAFQGRAEELLHHAELGKLYLGIR
jgi:branched-chain amino acid transport system ATP-binding protein